MPPLPGILHKLLSKQELLESNRLAWQIRHSANNPFLAILSVDSVSLHQALISFLETILNSNIQIVETSDPGYITSLFTESYREKYIILSLFGTGNQQTLQEVIQLLMFHRDSIPQYNLKHIYLGSNDFFRSVIRHGYDLYSRANARYRFHDLQAKMNADLEPVHNKPAEVREFEENLHDLEQYRQMKKPDQEALLQKILDTAFSGYQVSALDSSLRLYREGLKLAKKLKKSYEKSVALGNIGLIYSNKGDQDEALNYHKQALEIDKQIGYLQGQASDLGNIGLIYSDKGDQDEALKYLKQALEIHKQIGYLQGQASDLGNIGLIYRSKGDQDEALKYHKQALEIDKQIGYLQGQASDLGNIGLIYSDKGDQDEALKYLKQALEIHKQIGYLQGQASALGNIGLIYSDKGDQDEALKYHKQALEIHKQIGYLQGQAIQLGNIGLIYRSKGDQDEALKYLKQALEIHKQIGYMQGQANQLGNIGLIYSDKGDQDEALKYHKQALQIAENIKVPSLISKLKKNIDSLPKKAETK
jgi:tetratricopeptide (TPR) repeat protein